MKVMEVVEPGKDGVFRHVESLSDYAIARGVQVALAYSDRRAADRLMPFVRRVEAAKGETLNLRVGNAPALADLTALFRLRRFCRAVRPDIIHLHSSKAGALGRALRFTGVRAPIFYTPHAYYSMAQYAPKGWVFRWLERLFGRVGTTIHVSHDEAAYGREAIRLRPARQRVIENAVDTIRFHPGTREGRTKWRREHGLPQDAVIVGTVGRFSRQKDPVTHYQALLPVLRARRNVWTAHVGEGDLLAEARALWEREGIGHRVLSIPYLADTSGFFQTLDAFMLTSRFEGLSIAVLEALATDLPLILSSAPGNRDFLRLGLSHVWSAPGGNVPAFSAAVESWLNDRQSDRPSNHRVVAERKFSHDACYGRILEEYGSARARLTPGPDSTRAVPAPDPTPGAMISRGG